MKLFKHHYFSLVLIIIGLVLVGLSQAFDDKPLDDPDAANKPKDPVQNMIVGIIILLVGQILGALSYIFEEKFLSEYDDVHPLIVVGWEGVWGSLIVGVMLVAMQFIPCSNRELCSPSGVVEDSYSAIIELGTSQAQIIYTIFLIPLAAFYNTAGTSVTGYGSAAARCTIEQLRNALVWIYFMIFKVNDNYLEKFTVLQLIGFVVLFFGIMVFNEIIILPVFRKQTRYERNTVYSPGAHRKNIGDHQSFNIPKIEVNDMDESEDQTARLGEGSIITANEMSSAPALG